MLNRRQFFERTIPIASAGVALAAAEAWSANQLAWTKPIGLEMYTVREEFPKDPEGTLKKIAAIGYREVEIPTEIPAATLKGYLTDAGLTAPSTYPEVPKDVESWKKTLDHVKPYGVRYVVVGDNPKLDAEAWKKRADLFNECGKHAQQAGMQFCYHAHYHEFAPVDGTSGYDIMLTQCDPRLLKMEMDIFWATYAGQDPIAYFKKYPDRFPLLHIKDLKKGFPSSTSDFPYDNGSLNPFAPVGQGRIDWAGIFAHAKQAGTRHIFVEQDRCDSSPFDAIKTSFDYLKALRLN
jgi:sugar phosphate isomerase/epimerase